MCASQLTDKEYHDRFMAILVDKKKNNTYKFALARFLLDYSISSNKSLKIRYSKIAKSFFKYYWLQECKSRLRQGPINQTPEVITIIRAEFADDVYPQSYKEIQKKYKKEIKCCIDKIVMNCFDDVIHRFHNSINVEPKNIFFDYFAIQYPESGNARIDKHGGILLNNDARSFFRKNYESLYKSVILEWIRFLERKNIGIPYLVQKIEGIEKGPRNQSAFLKKLKPFVDNCFYCNAPFNSKETPNVDHVIPYDYINDTDLWNLVLTCRECNCKKSGSLPPKKFISDLLTRNKSYIHMGKINEEMKKSLTKLSYEPYGLILSQEEQSKSKNGSEITLEQICEQRGIYWHYDNASKHGYQTSKKLVQN